MQRTNSKKKRYVSNIMIIFGCIIILFASYNLYTIYQEYKKIDDDYDDIIENVVSIGEKETENNGTEVPVEEIVFSVDFDKLKEINEDVIGWIRFEQPEKISYPIAIGEDNDEYIRTNLYGEHSTAGTIFVDSANSEDFSDKNTFIYGHNMRNGSMFGTLKMYRDVDFYSQYPYFYIYTPDGKSHTYQIFAVCVVNTTSKSYTQWFKDDNAFLEYIDHVKSVALYQTDVEVKSDAKIISLSTCTNGAEDERLLIHGVLIDE